MVSNAEALSDSIRQLQEKFLKAFEKGDKEKMKKLSEQMRELSILSMINVEKSKT